MKNLRTFLLAVAAITTILAMFSFSAEKKIIVIDAGHGGKDHGATVESISEKDIVRNIAKKVSELGAGSNIEIVLLREDDSFVDLSERVKIANIHNPHLLISLHVDQDLSNSKSGVRAFVYQNDFHEASVKFAGKLLDQISNGALKKGNIESAPFFVLKNSKCPSVNLQLGNLSNANDREYITSEEGQEEIARNILAGIN